MHTEITNPDISLSPVTHRLGQSNRDGISGRLRRLAQKAVRNWQRRRMIAALRAMDDSLLDDIGVSRNEIPRIVNDFDDRELRMRPVSREVERQSVSSNSPAS
ncbi:DUF1127 domain-containing protein [Nitratireductor sp. GISD-1A_MAKvit]|uniref:DUF1127 domain-containing protein n=1 Tax=Nitratireductor sp. GISD-1A_MAKvit TaxID=3234198 RepID=UPI00346616EA